MGKKDEDGFKRRHGEGEGKWSEAEERSDNCSSRSSLGLTTFCSLQTEGTKGKLKKKKKNKEGGDMGKKERLELLGKRLARKMSGGEGARGYKGEIGRGAKDGWSEATAKALYRLFT